jgi:hypothetical protein
MSETGNDFPVPPASFDFLVANLRMQAEIQLGLIHFGEEKDRPEPNLPLARHAIDMLGMLSEKTRGNLTIEEQRMLENTLTELRFRFIQASEKPASGKAASEQPAPESGAASTE